MITLIRSKWKWKSRGCGGLEKFWLLENDSTDAVGSVGGKRPLVSAQTHDTGYIKHNFITRMKNLIIQLCFIDLVKSTKRGQSI